MKDKESYNKFIPKLYNEELLKNHFKETMCFSRKEFNNKSIINQKLIKFPIVGHEVWALFGKEKTGEWRCLQVGQSKNKVKAEIESLIEFMSYDYNQLVESIKDGVRNRDSTFYSNIYQSSKEEKNKFLYSHIASQYDEFQLGLLDIDKYLGIKNLKFENKHISNIMKIAKPLYAEAKLAFETKSIYWTMFNSGVDGQAIMIFLGDNKD